MSPKGLQLVDMPPAAMPHGPKVFHELTMREGWRFLLKKIAMQRFQSIQVEALANAP